jgi:myo-inositol 2-dehydrogenase / D-chiro-inositol 1-dehydrogenase
VSTGPVRLALLGLGSMGLHHLKIFHSLAPWAQITAVADSHPPFAERAAAIIPTAKAFHDPLDCLQNADLDAVVVATSDDTHPAIVEACIARGIYVLCEKPLTLSTEESLRLVKAERAGGRRLVQVGYMRRYDTDYRHIHDIARSGRVGQPILISQRHHNPLAFNTFDAQQLVVSSATHDIDLFRWFTGEEISVVNCAVKSSDDGSTVTVLITLTSETGILGVAEVGRGPGMRYDIGLDLVGSGGSLTLGSPALTAHAGPDGVAAQRLPDNWIPRFDGAYRSQDISWLTGVANHAVDGPSTYDGYATNAVADAALAALRTGRAQVVHQIPVGDLGQDGPRR